MEFEIILKLMTGVGAIFGIALTTSHLLANKSTGKLKRYEIFKELNCYLDDSPEKNFPMICAAVSCVSRRRLTLKEIRWFIKTPHAFDYMKPYSDQARYIELSKNMNSFKFSGKYSNRSARKLEHIGLIAIYIVLASIGLTITILTQAKVSTLPLIALGYAIGGTFILFGIMSLLQSEHLKSASSTVKHNFSPEIGEIHEPET